MSAHPKDILNQAARLGPEYTAPFPSARKIYLPGGRPDIRVPMREVAQSDTPASQGAAKNPPVWVYDTSGPYTDPQARIDVRLGLPALRAGWIEERGDSEALSGVSSEYGRARRADQRLDPLRFAHIRAPRRAKRGANVSQMHYARRGMVTPEMEFIA